MNGEGMAYETAVKKEPTLLERVARLEADLEREKTNRKATEEQAAESIRRLEFAIGLTPLEFPKAIDR